MIIGSVKLHITLFFSIRMHHQDQESNILNQCIRGVIEKKNNLEGKFYEENQLFEL